MVALTEGQHLILFAVFVAFFVLIGIVALLAVLGIIKTTAAFRKWAVSGFVVGVAGVVFVWAKSESTPDFFVNLEPPNGVDPSTFELVVGTYAYEYYESTTPGALELTAGQESGWWTAKFPYPRADKAVKLTLKDSKGNSWVVRPFYPNHNQRQQLISTHAARSKTTTPVSPLVSAGTAFAADREIRFNNYAKAIGTHGGRTYYKWRVFVDEPTQVLRQIAEVQYLLHPTFSEPFQVRTNPNDKFALETSGWGQFLIQITIKYRDLSSTRTSYYLDLSKGWPSSVGTSR